jgi:hypothetical protein
MKWKYAGVAAASVVATLVVGGAAMATMHGPLGPFGRADLNTDGSITKAEWMQAADTRFQQFDANKDGKLVAAELPKRPHGHRHGGPGKDDHRDGDDQIGAREPAPAPVLVNGASPVAPAK